MAKKSMPPLLIGLTLLAYIGIFIVLESTGYGLRFNQSRSLPFWVFLSSPIKEVSRDAYVSFSYQSYDKQIAKQIKGMPGDRIELLDNFIVINGQPLGIVKPVSSSGKVYSPIQPQTIPEGYVFVLASDEDSFDSRYQEFGLIEISSLKEDLWPIF